ncbi:MAG: S-layer homology domain-containing protein [Eubacteriales bacterium]
MKNSILGASFMSTILAVAISLSVSVAASDALTSSDALVEKIKGYEGFSSYAQWDSNQYSIGYGTVCDAGSYPNGITEWEAEALLREHIAGSETMVNNFTSSYGITLEQHQFDAMVSMTFNLGPYWLKSDTKVWKYLISGEYTDEEMASAMVAWCNAGGTMLEGLVTRRIDEAAMFLFADYDNSSGKSFVRAYYNEEGGSKSNDLTLHVEGQPYGTLATAEKSGYYFAGWFTADGVEVTSNTIATERQTLYARWSTTPVEEVVEPAVGTTGSATEATSIFSDVADDAWYAEYVYRLVEDGVLGGYDDGTFQPARSVSLGEALKIIMNAAGYEPQESVSEHWASGYFNHAYQLGLLEGVTMDTLDTAVTRENVAVLMSNILDVPETYEMDVFVDTNTHAANSLYALGIFAGTIDENGDRYFYPDQAISRGELAKVVVLMMDL